MSRPTVVRLIEDGELHSHVPGAVRRKLRLADVLAYREALRARRNRFMTESSAEFDDVDDDEVSDLVEMSKHRRAPAQSQAKILDELVGRYDMTEVADVLRPLLDIGTTP